MAVGSRHARLTRPRRLKAYCRTRKECELYVNLYYRRTRLDCSCQRSNGFSLSSPVLFVQTDSAVHARVHVRRPNAVSLIEKNIHYGPGHTRPAVTGLWRNSRRAKSTKSVTNDIEDTVVLLGYAPKTTCDPPSPGCRNDRKQFGIFRNTILSLSTEYKLYNSIACGLLFLYEPVHLYWLCLTGVPPRSRQHCSRRIARRIAQTSGKSVI